MKGSWAKRVLSGALSVVLVAGLCPGLAFAGTGEGKQASDASGQASSAASSLTVASTSASLTTQATTSKVAKYSYSATPILAPFNWAVYVKTDNPDPKSFRLADKSSKYLGKGEGPATFSVLERNYLDVKYEKAKTYRVNGGYIFYCYNVNSDGGALQVQQLNSDGTYSDTGKKVTLPALKTSLDYLVDTYAKGKSGFFNKLDAVQSGLYQLSVYPRTVYDSSKPNTTNGWPSLAASPYPELSLNDHYESLYARSSDGVFLETLHPYVLDSLGFPNTVAAAAKRLNSNCTVTGGSTHWEVVVTYNGESRTYGWAGSGGPGPFYSNTISKKFTFNGTSSDLAKNASVSSLTSLYLDCLSKSDAQLEKYRNMIQGSEFYNAIGTGSWARIGVESFFGGGGSTYAYITGSENKNYAWAVSDTWVDGCYVNQNESIVPGEKFSDHPQARVLIRNKSFKDAQGNAHKCDLIYYYDSSSNTWKASGYNYGYYSDADLPSSFILKPAQVKELIAKNSNRLPTAGKIYDGSKKPGTAFKNTAVTGISLPKTAVAYKKGSTKLSASVKPAGATEKRATWTSGNPKIATVSSDGTVTGVKPGTVKITAKTIDGAYTATCLVTVKNPTNIRKATVAKIADQKRKSSSTTGVTPKPVVKYGGKKLVEGKDYTLSYSNNWYNGTASVTITGINAFTDSVTKKFKIYTAVKKPTARNYKFDNKGHTGISWTDGYWIDGTRSATQPGTYRATIRLYSGYRWTDGTTKALKLTWKIYR